MFDCFVSESEIEVLSQENQICDVYCFRKESNAPKSDVPSINQGLNITQISLVRSSQAQVTKVS